MQPSLYSEVATTIGLQDRDVANVRSLAGMLAEAIPVLANRIYERLVQQDGAVDVIVGGARQKDNLRDAIGEWLGDLFEGRFGERHREKQRRIGAARVRAGVPQKYIVTGIEIVWQELSRWIREADVSNRDETLASLHRLLMVELAVMLEDYKSSYTREIRQIERSVVEEKLTRAEHLAEIGQLAASLAHEIKNPLAGISGAVQVIREAMSPDDPHQPIVTEILGQINRLDATVKDLLQYARPTPPRARAVAVGAVVNRVLNVLRKEPEVQRVRIGYEPPPAVAVVHADEAQIEQLLINLILNAAHASEDGGIIELKVSCDRDTVRLVVRDQGAGMSPEVRERAFEPFFTTKARGTGLGLTICRRIVEVHGGGIALDSQVGVGTTVTVTLPTNGKAHPPERPAQEHIEAR